MSDFFQNGVITNFHNLTGRSVESLEKDLVQFSKKRYFLNWKDRH